MKLTNNFLWNLKLHKECLCIFLALTFVIVGMCGCGKSKQKNHSGEKKLESKISATAKADSTLSSNSEGESQIQKSGQSAFSSHVTSGGISVPKVQSFDPDAAIRYVSQEIAKLNAGAVYKNVSNDAISTTVEIESSESQSDISNRLHDSVLDVLGYDAYIDFRESPEEAQPAVFTYYYYITYQGLSSDQTQHLFKISYELMPARYQTEGFDTRVIQDEAQKRALQQLGNKFSLATTGKKCSSVEMISTVKTFDNQADAIQMLSDEAVEIINGKNLNAANHISAFKIEYYAKSSSYYCFLLYLY